MNDDAPAYGKGHNQPPEDPKIDPVAEALKEYVDTMAEADNWLDGEKVETEAQMDAVDAILKTIRKAGTAMGKAEKAYVGPRHKAWQDAKALWAKPITDLKNQKTGLAKLVSDFKIKLAKEKEEAARLARIAAKKLEDDAKAAIAAADKGNIEEVREAEAKVEDAKIAKQESSAANKDTVKGLRTVHHHAVDDYKAAINWIATNDKDAIRAFVDEYAKRNHRDSNISGVRSWSEKAAF